MRRLHGGADRGGACACALIELCVCVRARARGALRHSSSFNRTEVEVTHDDNDWGISCSTEIGEGGDDVQGDAADSAIASSLPTGVELQYVGGLYCRTHPPLLVAAIACAKPSNVKTSCLYIWKRETVLAVSNRPP
eukprot:COSAG01_NODE_90_length_27307_cov_734.166458_13_plen_136_part_00